jgi:uncharacterized Fe-S cluster protein YjdI
MATLISAPLSTMLGVALCSCGASKNKPFCDGTHGIIGFSSKNKETSDGSPIIKAAECVNNLPSVFKFNSRPWISPDVAEKEKIINTIKKCPSGALSYSIDDVEYRDQNERRSMVTVSKDGPYTLLET